MTVGCQRLGPGRGRAIPRMFVEKSARPTPCHLPHLSHSCPPTPCSTPDTVIPLGLSFPSPDKDHLGSFGAAQHSGSRLSERGRLDYVANEAKLLQRPVPTCCPPPLPSISSPAHCFFRRRLSLRWAAPRPVAPLPSLPLPPPPYDHSGPRRPVLAENWPPGPKEEAPPAPEDPHPPRTLIPGGGPLDQAPHWSAPHPSSPACPSSPARDVAGPLRGN
ncbi:uncharacterized protein LOC107522270 [Erinaceus europaeus]|uniref:Uncharacterized protein LOC107522270 n=1 Tax=Erinaceus europaeus TaxID=9365 RepID=A0ABM3WKE1_ERIEU|nr:uncharacterized protein LOC107522270 [Erinaceus europaeus]XP_060037045.1 uncharacterized protein LOC107522270 [Erinaceus europaeus]